MQLQNISIYCKKEPKYQLTQLLYSNGEKYQMGSPAKYHKQDPN